MFLAWSSTHTRCHARAGGSAVSGSDGRRAAHHAQATAPTPLHRTCGDLHGSVTIHRHPLPSGLDGGGGPAVLPKRPWVLRGIFGGGLPAPSPTDPHKITRSRDIGLSTYDFVRRSGRVQAGRPDLGNLTRRGHPRVRPEGRRRTGPLQTWSGNSEPLPLDRSRPGTHPTGRASPGGRESSRGALSHHLGIPG